MKLRLPGPLVVPPELPKFVLDNTTTIFSCHSCIGDFAGKEMVCDSSVDGYGKQRITITFECPTPE